MKKNLLLITFLCLSAFSFSQRKSELIAQIDNLRTELDSLGQQLAEAKREISSSTAKAETLEAENVGLRDANATLLKNLGNFSELSKQNTKNVNSAMSALAQKEKQLSGINDMISANDSTAIVSLTRIKQTLGENAKVNVSEGIIVISNSVKGLFGSDTGSEFTEEGKAWLSNVAKVIMANPNFTTEIEGLNITGEFGPTFDQVAAVAKELVGTLNVPSDKLDLSAKDGNFREGINIKLQPDYRAFYAQAKNSVKIAQ
ncbi:hypothetical protein GTQ34_02840 [Muricauda sp. JGD-17]|uniref:Uncharacterized protein n=1 Tax=Flagellimonas ochracea TaxID=2696472 RepID=A0A964T9T0_9FLAO|nr:hypothetical protein [Allomuricauda ochracea]NAY90844.1 hypothetical protein [Allomuricauda ochracea]